MGGALTVLVLPDAQLINFAILSQVLNGVLLPVVIILMLLLINRRDLMGEHKNSRLWNVIAWSTSLIVIGMTMVMLWGMMPGHSSLQARFLSAPGAARFLRPTGG